MSEPNIPQLQTRRQFLRTSLMGAAATLTIPVFLQKTFAAMDEAALNSSVQATTGKDGTILVVLQMGGGNDGLNTLVPYGDDAYYQARPVIALPGSKVLHINDYLGLHPQLGPLKELYDAGNLAIMQGVGYPNPNRSHFRAMEIWQTASDAEKLEHYGWLGRYFDSECKGADPLVGLAVSNSLPQAFSSRSNKAIAFSSPEKYRWKADGMDKAADSAFAQANLVDEQSGASIGTLGNAMNAEMDVMDYLQRTAIDAQVSSARVRNLAGKAKGGNGYPANQLGRSLNLVARMIEDGMPTRIYYVNQGGYDTHRDQLNSHANLMTDLGASIAAFCRDLKAQGNFDRVVLMTFSEFGRRVKENSSAGTDHGAAGPMFIVGGGVKPGLFGNTPSLIDLHQGDLKYQIDFRSVYATLIDKHLGGSSRNVLGRQYPNLAFV